MGLNCSSALTKQSCTAYRFHRIFSPDSTSQSFPAQHFSIRILFEIEKQKVTERRKEKERKKEKNIKQELKSTFFIPRLNVLKSAVKFRREGVI